ncbi:MAG: YraN family protein [Nitrospinaceae bacterium]
MDKGAHIRFGQAGEAAALKFLQKKGYRILEQNFRTKAGEIDLVAEQEGVLVFVEVKARTGMEFGGPARSVTLQKQKRLARTARQFLARNAIRERSCRFDVVTLVGDPGNPKSWKIDLLADAFRL